MDAVVGQRIEQRQAIRSAMAESLSGTHGMK